MEGQKKNTVQILDLMNRINRENMNSERVEFNEEKLDAILEELKMTFSEIIDELTPHLENLLEVKTSRPEWKFLVLNFYCLHKLHMEMKTDDLLSITQAQELRKDIYKMIHVGILQNLTPSLPHFKCLRSENIDPELQYYMLKASVCGLFKCSMLPTLRYYLLIHTIDGILVALFQLAYCPLKKPFSSNTGEFQMTESFYRIVLADQEKFRDLLDIIRNSINPTIYLREIMLLLKSTSPKWFKKAVSATLTNYVKEKNGLENILRTMLDGVYYDNSSMWKIIDIITQIICVCISLPDFDACISPQIANLVHLSLQSSSERNLAFEKVFAAIVKCVNSIEPKYAKRYLNIAMSPLEQLSNKSSRINPVNVDLFPEQLLQNVRLIQYIFLDTKDTSLPLCYLTPYIGLLINFLVSIENSDLIGPKNDVQNIIQESFKNIERSICFSIFENVIFNIDNSEVLIFRDDLEIFVSNSQLRVLFSESCKKYDVSARTHTIFTICKSDKTLYFLYFGFLLYCLTNSKRYFSDLSLLEAKDQGDLSKFENKLAVYEMLSILSANGLSNRYFSDKFPEEMFDYFNLIFLSAMRNGSHKNDSDPTFHIIFTIAMILENILKTSANVSNLYQTDLLESIKTLHDNTSSTELKILLDKILKPADENSEYNVKDEMEELIEEAFSDSIPIRGHALIALERLVSSKNEKAVERKHLIFTIFKENLSNRDTYIYQAAIKGAASMADLDPEFTVLILETLCDEYTNFVEDEFGPDAVELRLKMGEILVQISKKLGDMAPRYKALLLNTFLNGTKEEDHLMRTSALANLGEISRVLGTKLGTIITEILACVHDIIISDKYPEPKRAAILVIRQLLQGLGHDMLQILKDDILAIYRTLKDIYKNDKDEILVLQSQLALEELNKNMTDIITPQVKFDNSKNKITF